MQAGEWQAASSILGRALRGGGSGAAQAVPYYVAARLLAAGSSSNTTTAAKLARYAGAAGTPAAARRCTRARHRTRCCIRLVVKLGVPPPQLSSECS